jgi:hypothetical protein
MTDFHDTNQPLRKVVQIRSVRLRSGIVKGCTLDLGFGAAPQLSFFVGTCRRRPQVPTGEEVLRGHPEPRQRAAPFAIPLLDGRSERLICVMTDFTGFYKNPV